ncbi:heme ABC transporter ATP-binding protein [Corynebacterium sp. 320]|uniref:heme ABC transporter ATP-binding protein n=1 Tax=Corynebacterium TaxID=1716 RepID=UPI00125CA927|nr:MULTISPECIES: heme ABC transporter ATP-binding protein [Corynebacterium]KAB1502449.1 heme ABC transporter ATP-binding protein [Corynebacterium sp. 320]KAB1551330.1 heme ABC transporter ATP-binding protein [Corynebacterium sp. 321]KAB1551841.1 heme ABC transporter ATP-binding protein [Corynebacterium sp. 319]KAB3526056.1 heme ABC transporter ATP-binding protein [Corynebacterium sp. 250]KAB3538836.1 heme ABC transporter ATP-binding protein [Corynebacterium sp. 366]
MAITPILSCTNVGLTVGGACTHEVLKGVDVQVLPGEVVGLIGPNGAGKSTLLSVLSGDIEPDAGSVLLKGRAYSSYSDKEAARIRSVMMQNTQVSFSFSVRDVVAMGRSAWGKDSDDEQRVAHALEQVGLGEHADRDITTLSGGECARAALARIIVQDSDVVILDEPTAAMDIGHSEKTMLHVRDMAASGKAVLVVIHDLETAARHCDRVVLLKEGEVVAQGMPAHVCTSENLSDVYGWPVDVAYIDGVPWIRAAHGQRSQDARAAALALARERAQGACPMF